MRVSTKVRYGLRFLLDLAQHGRGGPVSLRDVAVRQDISQKYLWQVVTPLKAAGLITAERGSQGGYTLNRAPDKITLLDLYRILEGELVLVDCGEGAEGCARHGNCAAQDVWDEISGKLEGALAAITLQSVVERDTARREMQLADYVI